MFNDGRRYVRIRVIDSNTGNIVRSEEILTDETLSKISCRFATKEYIVIATRDDNSFYCFYISGETYYCSLINDNAIINFFEEVLSGLYDNARDSFHIKYGRVSTLCQCIDNTDSSKCDELLTCVDNLWNVRYYSRFIKRRKNK